MKDGNSCPVNNRSWLFENSNLLPRFQESTLLSSLPRSHWEVFVRPASMVTMSNLTKTRTQAIIHISTYEETPTKSPVLVKGGLSGE
jgi:hypothetical protein